eukprot:3119054-Prymnesium_polylepis.1
MDADTHPAHMQARLSQSNRTTQSAPASAHTKERCRWGRDVGGAVAPRPPRTSQPTTGGAPPRRRGPARLASRPLLQVRRSPLEGRAAATYASAAVTVTSLQLAQT